MSPVSVNRLFVKARLHRRFLSQQLDAIFVARKLEQVSNMFEIPAISRRQLDRVENRTWFTRGILELQLAYLSATKIGSSCRNKNRPCKRALDISEEQMNIFKTAAKLIKNDLKSIPTSEQIYV